MENGQQNSYERNQRIFKFETVEDSFDTNTMHCAEHNPGKTGHIELFSINLLMVLSQLPIHESL